MVLTISYNERIKKEVEYLNNNNSLPPRDTDYLRLQHGIQTANTQYWLSSNTAQYGRMR